MFATYRCILSFMLAKLRFEVGPCYVTLSRVFIVTHDISGPAECKPRWTDGKLGNVAEVFG